MADKKKIYNTLPFIYDHIMREVNYKEWADYLFSVCENYIGEKAKALELAAGNCKLAASLKKYIPDLLVTDLSAEMLKMDSSKLNKICCEMTKIPVKGKYDLIFSTFDSVNYLTSKKKILDLFKGIHDIISDDGIFTFDVSLKNNSIKHIRTPVRKGSFQNVEYKHLSEYNPASRIHKNIFLIKLSSGEIIKEIHKQKIYDFEVYFDLLNKAGLFVVECLEGFSFKDGNAESPRVQFITMKNKRYAVTS